MCFPMTSSLLFQYERWASKCKGIQVFTFVSCDNIFLQGVMESELSYFQDIEQSFNM